MRISVITPTFRLGGLDLLKWTLDQQTMNPADFELVLVDGLHWHREAAVAALFADAPYRVVHVPPEPIDGEPVFPRDAHPRYRNTGIKHASGELCVLTCDYIMALPSWLALFDHRVRTLPDHYAVCGTHLYGLPPKEIIDPRLLESGGPPSLGFYMQLVDGLPANDGLWTSSFTTDLEYVFALTQTAVFSFPLDRQDPKLRLMSGTTMTINALHMKNECVRREHLLRVRGLDETYNDTKCADDLDLAIRLNQLGVTFVMDKGIDVLIPDPHIFTPALRRKRGYDETLLEWSEKRRPILLAGETQPQVSLLPPWVG